MTTLKDIFEKIEGREWDNFNETKDKKFLSITECHIFYFSSDSNRYSIPDLLSNKSWCVGVWGENYCNYPISAFAILLERGENPCLDFIYKTMI